jgi:outer membrane lipoprotein carrier protein
MALVLFAGPLVAGEPGGDPGRPSDSTPVTNEETRQPEEAEPLLDRILSKMDEAYHNVQSYQAEFEQESETKTFQRKSKASGKVYFLKPSKMRWMYLEPEPREVYLCGEKMRMYLPSRNQVMEQTLTDAMPGLAPARLFMGVQELLGSFSISLDCPEAKNESAYCLRLTPKDRRSMTVEEILLWVGKTDFLPLRTESRDVLGNRTHLVFRNGEANVPLKEELFRFEIPPDAEVIRSTF